MFTSHANLCSGLSQHVSCIDIAPWRRLQLHWGEHLWLCHQMCLLWRCRWPCHQRHLLLILFVAPRLICICSINVYTQQVPEFILGPKSISRPRPQRHSGAAWPRPPHGYQPSESGNQDRLKETFASGLLQHDQLAERPFATSAGPGYRMLRAFSWARQHNNRTTGPPRHTQAPFIKAPQRTHATGPPPQARNRSRTFTHNVSRARTTPHNRSRTRTLYRYAPLRQPRHVPKERITGKCRANKMARLPRASQPHWPTATSRIYYAARRGRRVRQPRHQY